MRDLTGLRPAHLTFAVEEIGEREPSEQAVPVLLPLLDHPSPLVREGVVYGLRRHKSFPGVSERLTRIAQHDASPAVREAATDALED